VSNEAKISISLITLLICYFFREQWDGGPILQMIGLLFFIIGGIMAILGGLTLGENLTSSHHPKGFVTKGIYSKIRHPMDYGGIILVLGFSILMMSLYGLILAMVLVIPLHIYTVVIEERIMIAEFGMEYKEYKEKTLF
jgi:protein-S-isoprenylcysteine O-methyltransferase Ste14